MANFNLSDNSLASLAGEMSSRDMGRLINAINAALVQAEKDFPMREGITGDEAKRRVGFCVQMAKELYSDQGWTPQKIIDHMWQALKAKLSSRVWVPNDRMFYPVPEQPGQVH